ncbi:ribbon-helix-helix domain-containing protein [Microcoleus sp. MON1_C5]|uniref:ribbon-helix-helix domain-containing protein n=1 Tax=Microcoleus sp. MON1_C5 TaxID=2818828 RepID=UPI002FD72D1E
MTCTINSELLSELDDACYKNRVNRSKFVREAVASYLKHFHAPNEPLNTPSEEALAV